MGDVAYRFGGSIEPPFIEAVTARAEDGRIQLVRGFNRAPLH